MAIKMPPRKINAAPKITRPGVQSTAPAGLRKPGIPASTGTGFVSQGGFAKARQINEERERGFKSRAERGIEFGMKIGEGGVNGVTIILVDKQKLPAMPYFHYMHRWGFEQNKPRTEVCIQDDPEGCDLCRSLSRKGRFEMVLTCIDTRPYTYTKGPKAGQRVARSRKPYIVTSTMIPVFERIYAKHKTFRGLVLKLHRDGQKSPGGGSTVEVIRQLSEAELAKYGNLSVPIDFSKAYPRLTPAQMRENYSLSGGGQVGGDDLAGDAGGRMVSEDDVPF